MGGVVCDHKPMGDHCCQVGLVAVIADLLGKVATDIVVSIAGRSLEQASLVVIGESALLQTLIPADEPR